VNRALILLSALGLMACGKTSYVTGKPPGASFEKKGSYFIGGLIGSTDINLGQLCPNGVSSFVNQKTVTDGVMTCITCGLYSPITINITCASGSTYLLQPNPERNITKVIPVLAASEGGEQ
jgi:hypothetical protein